MMTFHILVVVAVVSSMLVWVALSLYVLAIDRRRVNARQIVDVAIGVLGDDAGENLPLDEKLEQYGRA